MSMQRLSEAHKLDLSTPPQDGGKYGLKGSAIAVLRWLAWRENKESKRCDPGHGDIARGIGVSTTTVETALDQLRDIGLVSWKPQKTSKGAQTTNAYTLHLPQNPGEPPTENRGTPSPESGDEPKGLNRSSKPDKAAAAACHPEEDDEFIQQVNAVFAFWVTSTERSASTRLTPQSKQAIVNALGMYEVAELEEAIGNWKRSDWFSGRKPRDGKPRNQLRFLLKDADSIEELRELSRGARTALDIITSRPADDSSFGPALYDAGVEEVPGGDPVIAELSREHAEAVAREGGSDPVEVRNVLRAELGDEEGP